jgi:transcriptional regulator with XRE-family HTH domain
MEQERAPTSDGKGSSRAKNEIGPIGQRVAQNIKQLRERSRLSQEQLAAAVRRLGRPVNRSAVTKTEDATRRIDVDDLVAFALALRSTPNRLLLPGTADIDKPYQVTPEYRVSERNAWLWALGERPLDRGFDAPELQIVVEDDRLRGFTQENRPHRPMEHPLSNPVMHSRELMKALRDIVREAQRLGAGIELVHYALENAYMWADIAIEDGDDGQG